MVNLPNGICLNTCFLFIERMEYCQNRENRRNEVFFKEAKYQNPSAIENLERVRQSSTTSEIKASSLGKIISLPIG